MQKATKATKQAAKQNIGIVAHCCPSENEIGNSMKASDIKHVAFVAFVAHVALKNSLRM